MNHDTEKEDVKHWQLHSHSQNNVSPGFVLKVTLEDMFDSIE